jgi:hypothetical protein
MPNRVVNDGLGIGFPQTLVDQGDGTYALKVSGGGATGTAAIGTVTIAVVTATTVTATIAANGTRSAEIDIGNGRILTGIRMPALWTTANMSFLAGASAALQDLYDDAGVRVSVVVGGGRTVQIGDPAKWIGIRYLKVRSGATSTSVAQTAARSVVLVMGM